MYFLHKNDLEQFDGEGLGTKFSYSKGNWAEKRKKGKNKKRKIQNIG
jgi:hypothetical protein